MGHINAKIPVKEKIIRTHRDLVQTLAKHNYNYYVLDKPLISDREYDRLYQELLNIEQKYGLTSMVTTKVGNSLSAGFEKVKHTTPMLSLSNTYSPQEVEDFIRNTHQQTPSVYPSISVEEKVDGLSLSLTYNNGELIQAVTRGDGEVGDLVTDNAKMIIGVPYSIPHVGLVNIRGEVYITKSDFLKINADNEGRYANPRNLASGTLKLKGNPKEIKSRRLRFLAYYIQEYTLKGESLQTTYENQYQLLQEQGFNTPRQKILKLSNLSAKTFGTFFEYYELCDSRLQNLFSVLKAFENHSRTSDIPTDGIVLKWDYVHKRDILGETFKAPRWAVAYKFSADSAQTTLNQVLFSVGRSGTITPIALFDPVQLCGTTVKRATLHNQDFINELELRIGDTISVEKGGEIIPKVVSVIASSNGPLVKIPTKCPQCNSRLVESKSRMICPNTYGKCDTQFVEKLALFASREALNIQGLGRETCVKLVDSGVTSLTDLITLTVSDIEALDGFKTPSAFKLYKAIQQSKDMPASRWLFAFGIKGVGQVMAENIFKHFKTWNAIKRASIDDLSMVEGLGEVLSNEVYDWFHDDQNIDMVKKFKAFGMPRKYLFESKAISNMLKDYRVVITGTFDNYSRDFLQKKIELLGGEYHNSVKKNSTHLMTGDNTGKNKIEEASKRGLKVLSKEESLKLLQLKNG